MEEVLCAVISAGSALAVCVITQIIGNSRTRTLIEYRLGQLEKKVDKHNQLADRMATVEAKVANLEEK